VRWHALIFDNPSILGLLRQSIELSLLNEFRWRKQRKASSGSPTIDAFSDADWAGDRSTSRSTSEVVILLSGNPIVFSSRQQSIVALSSSEAEYVAACTVGRELEWLASFLGELKVPTDKPKLFIDNLGAIRQIKANQISSKSKHIRWKFHFIRQLYEEGVFEIHSINSLDQKADFLTKPHAGPRLKQLRTGCGVQEHQPLTNNGKRIVFSNSPESGKKSLLRKTPKIR